jgi:hypothetical protein
MLLAVIQVQGKLKDTEQLIGKVWDLETELHDLRLRM